MNKEKRIALIPEWRFSEFTDCGDWEKKTLESISPSIFDGTHQTPRYIDTGIPFFSVENIVSGTKNKYISKEDYLIATSKNRPEKGDILITRIGNIGFSAIVTWDYDFSIYVTLAVIKQSKMFNSYFLHSFLQSSIYQKEIKSKSLLNAVPCKINMNELRMTNVFIPKSKNEQQKIADCISSLDELIAAENKKLETLKAHKKSLMQKLFPTEGRTVPEIRLNGFTNAWEKRKLGDVAELSSSKRIHVSDYVPAGIPFYRGSEISTGGFSKNNELYISEEMYNEIKEKYGVPVQGDLLITAVGTLGNIWKVDDRKFYYKDGNLICLGKLKLDADYLIAYLMNGQGKKKILDSAAGSSQKALTMVKLNMINLAIPDIAEQIAIGKLFCNLNELITAQAEKIETLKAHKKGLLQGLFPSVQEVIE